MMEQFKVTHDYGYPVLWLVLEQGKEGYTKGSWYYITHLTGEWRG